MFQYHPISCSRAVLFFLLLIHPYPLDSESLEAIAKVVDELLPEIKAISDGITVNRLVCGGCLDFKLMMTVPLEDFGSWEEGGHEPESKFLEKIKAIEGVSQVETQTITNMVI